MWCSVERGEEIFMMRYLVVGGDNAIDVESVFWDEDWEEMDEGRVKEGDGVGLVDDE